MRHTKQDSGPEKCDVKGCKEEAARSLAAKTAAKGLPGIELKEGRHVKLCKDHYRQFKKNTKTDRKMDSLGW